jgi:nucleoid DNA-binding protein
VSQKTIPFFKTGKQLRDRLNGKEPAAEESQDS